MADRKHGDRIIVKRPDGHYDILRVESLNCALREGVPTLEDARQIARSELAAGGTVWYRDHRDEADHLEPL